MSEVMAIFCFAKRLKRQDLPTFGLPIMAILGALGSDCIWGFVWILDFMRILKLAKEVALRAKI